MGVAMINNQVYNEVQKLLSPFDNDFPFWFPFLNKFENINFK